MQFEVCSCRSLRLFLIHSEHPALGFWCGSIHVLLLNGSFPVKAELREIRHPSAFLLHKVLLNCFTGIISPVSLNPNGEKWGGEVISRPLWQGRSSTLWYPAKLCVFINFVKLLSSVQRHWSVETGTTVPSFPTNWTGWSANWSDWNLHQVLWETHFFRSSGDNVKKMSPGWFTCSHNDRCFVWSHRDPGSSPLYLGRKSRGSKHHSESSR